MQLQYSSQNFSFKLGKYPHYIAKNSNGYYIVSYESTKTFSDFLFLSHFSNYYLITISKTDFIVYKVGKEIEQVIKISNLNACSKDKLFEYVILNTEADFVKITNDLKVYYLDYANTSHKTVSLYNKKSVEIPEIELSVFCSNNMLSSVTAKVFYPYDGNITTTFYFTD